MRFTNIFRAGNRTDGDQQSTPSTSSRAQCGVVALHSPAGDCVADIVFVHGLMGHREDTWRSKAASGPWIQTLLPDEIPYVRVLTFGYDAGVIGGEVSQNTIRNHSKSLIMSLQHLRQKDQTSGRPLLFACHSLGGLVVEDAIVYAKQRPEDDPDRTDFYDHIQGILFLGTPHCGADLHQTAAVLRNLAQLVAVTNKHVIGVLDKDSAVLANIQDQFLTIIQPLLVEKRIRITCFAEELKTPGVGLVVPPSSAHLPGIARNSTIHANHRDMVRFASVNDDGFSLIVGELSDMVRFVRAKVEYKEELLKRAYAKYKRFKDGGCRDFGLLDKAIIDYTTARRLSATLTVGDRVIVIRADIGLAECHREMSHRRRYTLIRKLIHVEDANKFIKHALMLAEQVGHRDLLWRAKVDGAVVQARRAILLSRDTTPGDVEARKAVEQAREDLNRLRGTPEVTEYAGFVEWVELWLSKLPFVD